MALSPSPSLVVLALVFLRLTAPSFSKTETEILLKFKESLQNATALSNWDPARAAPCTAGSPNWYGLLCVGDKVLGLNLNSKGLSGTIDVESLVELPSFRVFSAMDNNFQGPLPAFKKLGSLKFLYMSRNKFSGEVPDNSFTGMKSLKKVHLADNQFSGSIPSSLATSQRLIELMLENNNFYGKIPNFTQQRLTVANFSNNNLEGEIPAKISNLNASSFSGNAGLCGKPLEPCQAGDSTESNSPVKTIIIAAIAVTVALVVATAIIFAVCKRKPKADLQDSGSTRAQVGTRTASSVDLDKMERGSHGARSPDHPAAGGKRSSDHHQAAVKLSFLRDDVAKFDLADLLKASAEVLGNGVFGSTYKAALSSAGPVVVVKRFRQMNNVGREDFLEHMRRLGRLNHKNVLPIVAFYYRKEEKLLVFDYVEKSSLASHLHGKKSKPLQHKDLDWPTRLKIVKGVARGMLYLYNELPSMTAPNGNLKSSNVLLDSSYEPLMSDYGLLPIVNRDHAEEHMVAYKSPDYKQGGRLNKKTDVWVLGILILETLTGKCPPDVDTTAWVQSVAPTPEAFDEEMKGVTQNSEGEIIKLLKIGLRCCEVDVEKRWDMKEAAERIDEVRERDGEDDFYSSYTSDDVRSSRGLSDDFNQV